ncbi:hypothetical protein HN011_008378 [Eciton burchellii]|nr:hypothetical protein HN011_008378 [Eciton burchellii]
MSFDRYYSFNKPLLRIIALWPFEQSKYVQLQFILLWGILTAVIIFQLTTFLTSKCTLNFIIKILSSILFFNFVWTVYILFHSHIEAVKNLLIEIFDVCNQLIDKNEVAIIKKYRRNAKRFTVVLSTFALGFMCAIIIGQFSSDIFDFLLPKNESRQHQMYITTEYFLDQEKFYYLIQIHLSIAVVIGIMMILSIGTTLISYTQYVCALFKIASYRLEYSIRNDDIKNENFLIIKLVRAIDIHRQAMRLCDLLMYTFETFFFISIMLAVTCLSLNLFRISQIASSNADMKEFILPVTYTFVCIKCMFLANFIGQDITDHYNAIYLTAYNFQWYKTPTNIQKLILFLLQRGVKNFALNVGGMFDASLECFATLIKASVSYFTVIYSTR